MSGKSMFYRFVTISRAAQARIATRQLEDLMPYVECFPECQARDLFICTCQQSAGTDCDRCGKWDENCIIIPDNSIGIYLCHGCMN